MFNSSASSLTTNPSLPSPSHTWMLVSYSSLCSLARTPAQTGTGSWFHLEAMMLLCGLQALPQDWGLARGFEEQPEPGGNSVEKVPAVSCCWPTLSGVEEWVVCCRSRRGWGMKEAAESSRSLTAWLPGAWSVYSPNTLRLTLPALTKATPRAVIPEKARIAAMHF